MNETKRYLAHLTVETADTITGEILERRSNGVYLYKEVRTGAYRFATPNTTEEYTVGSRVRIDRPSASRSVVGSQDVITGRVAKEQRGLSGTTPSTDREYFDRASITSVDPDPLILTAGGAAGVQTITGHGFTEAASYFARGDSPDPELTETEAADVSDTEVVMTISADAASPLGDFHVAINGAVASTALRILAARRVPTLWYWRADGSELLSVNKTTGAIIGAWANPGGDSTYRPLVSDGSYVYALTTTHLLRVRMSTGVADSYALTVTPNYYDQAAAVSGKVYYAEADPAVDTPRRLVRYDPATSTSDFVLLGSAEGKYRYLLNVSGSVIFGVSTELHNIPFIAYPFTLDTSNGATAFSGTAAEVMGGVAGLTGAHVAFIGGDVSSVYSIFRHDRASLVFDASNALTLNPWYCATSDPSMYIVEDDSPTVYLHIVNVGTFGVQTVTLPDITTGAGVALDSALAYIASESEDVIQTVNRSTLAVSNFAAPAAVGAMILA
jgi:hypothetical protein